MALVFADGFDHYNGIDVLKKWTGWVGSADMSATLRTSALYARPPGGLGLCCLDASGNRGIYKTLAATHVTFVSGFNVYFPATPTTSFFWATFDSTSGTPGGTPQLALRGDGAGHLVIARGTTTIATSTKTFSTATWYHVEIKATINNSTGAYEVKVNGSSTGWLPAATSQNTRGQSSNNYIDIVGLETGGQTGTQFDDFYFLSSTSPNNDFIGPQKIMTVFPMAAGNYSQWSGNYATNYANVSEIGGDSDNTFNQSATANQIDTFAFDDVPAGTIAAVQHVLMTRKDAGAARTIAPLSRTGGTDYAGTTLSVAGSYQFLTDPADVDPATSSAWTVSNFNAHEHGYKLIS